MFSKHEAAEWGHSIQRLLNLWNEKLNTCTWYAMGRLINTCYIIKRGSGNTLSFILEVGHSLIFFLRISCSPPCVVLLLFIAYAVIVAFFITLPHNYHYQIYATIIPSINSRSVPGISWEGWWTLVISPRGGRETFCFSLWSLIIFSSFFFR